MCFNCGDMIDMCAEDECYIPSGGPYGKARKFYIGDLYCRHLQAEYGHLYALWCDRYGEDDDVY